MGEALGETPHKETAMRAQGRVVVRQVRRSFYTISFRRWIRILCFLSLTIPLMVSACGKKGDPIPPEDLVNIQVGSYGSNNDHA
jgi:hypothetical protein